MTIYWQQCCVDMDNKPYVPTGALTSGFGENQGGFNHVDVPKACGQCAQYISSHR